LWVRRYNGPGDGDDEANAVVTDDSSNVYITGRSVGINSGWDYATIKYNPNGIQQWVARYNDPIPGNGNDIAYVVAIDAQRNVYVTGESFDTSGIYDYATIKYSQLVGIVQNTNNLPMKMKLYQNFPNPFNPTTNIGYQLAQNNSDVSIQLFDICGRKVEEVLHKKQSTGSHQLIFDGSRISSGVYFYSLFVNGEKIDTKKLMLIK